jgi:hypothetical protein
MVIFITGVLLLITIVAYSITIVHPSKTQSTNVLFLMIFLLFTLFVHEGLVLQAWVGLVVNLIAVFILRLLNRRLVAGDINVETKGFSKEDLVFSAVVGECGRILHFDPTNTMGLVRFEETYRELWVGLDNIVKLDV